MLCQPRAGAHAQSRPATGGIQKIVSQINSYLLGRDFFDIIGSFFQNKLGEVGNVARVGFIHDKLEIKFLVLYIMSRVAAPIDLPTLADLTLCDEGVDYFDFAAAVSELVETEHMTLDHELYEITDKGRKNGGICEDSLPYSIRVKCERSVSRLNSRLRRDAQVRADWSLHPDGAYTLHMTLDDEHGNLLTLELMAATETQAERLAEQFKAHPEQIYNGVLDVLLADYEGKD